MKKTTWAMVSALIVLGASSYGSIVINFADYDGVAGIDQTTTLGNIIALTDGTYNFNLKLVDMWDTSGLKASDGVAHKLSMHLSNGMGFNSLNASDATTTIDNGEILFLSFDQDVTLDAIVMAAFTDPESGTLTIGTGTPIALATGGASQTIGQTISAGTVFAIQAGNPTTMGVKSMTVTAIPEPATMGLIGLTCVGLLTARRFFIL